MVNDIYMPNRKSKEEKRARLVKRVLTFVLCSSGLYVMFSPFIQAAFTPYSQEKELTKGYKYASITVLQNLDELKIKPENLKPIPKDNTLVIPKIGVDTTIYEGESEKTLNKGIWRRPHTSTPEKGGNTVLAAHRYMYTSGPHTFFHLDKMTVGDKIMVFWEGKEYAYEIFQVEEVLPSAIEIEDNTKEPILTLFTCAPLYSNARRLVVKAKLIE